MAKETLDDLLPLETLVSRRPLLNVAEAALVLRCDESTVRNGLRDGRIDGLRAGGGGTWLVRTAPLMESMGICQGAPLSREEALKRDEYERAADAVRRAAAWWEAIGS